MPEQEGGKGEKKRKESTQLFQLIIAPSFLTGNLSRMLLHQKVELSEQLCRMYRTPDLWFCLQISLWEQPAFLLANCWLTCKDDYNPASRWSFLESSLSLVLVEEVCYFMNLQIPTNIFFIFFNVCMTVCVRTIDVDDWGFLFWLSFDIQLL